MLIIMDDPLLCRFRPGLLPSPPLDFFPGDRQHLARLQVGGPSPDDLAPGLIEGGPVVGLERGEQGFDDLQTIVVGEVEGGSQDVLSVGIHATSQERNLVKGFLRLEAPRHYFLSIPLIPKAH